MTVDVDAAGQGRKLVFPIIALIVVGIVLDYSGLDLLIAEQIYNWQHQQWALRDHFITETLLHKTARQWLVLFALGVLAAALISRWRPEWRRLQAPLWYLLVCLLTTPAIVAIGKALTHVDCPWDVQALGGSVPYLHLFETHPDTWRYGRCFPGGHSSGGFALVALYFFFLRVKPAWRMAGLYTGLLAGLVFGLAQQLRGAHFMSHDLWSLAIAGVVSGAYYYLFFGSRISLKVLRRRVTPVLLIGCAISLIMLFPATAQAAKDCHGQGKKVQALSCHFDRVYSLCGRYLRATSTN